MRRSAPADVAECLAQLTFAVVSTLDRDAGPHAIVVWIGRDDSVQVRGPATMSPDPGSRLVERLSQTYLGGPYPGFAGPSSQRVVARIAPDEVMTSWRER
jgi:hypothetical protein